MLASGMPSRPRNAGIPLDRRRDRRAVHIRRPRIDHDSHVAHLDRNELGAILVTAGLSSPHDHALVSLLALNGLRVSEAIGADINALGLDVSLERGHRTLTVVRKGSKTATMPLAPRVARAVDLAIGERLEGPIFVEADGRRLGRHAAGRIVRRVARRAGIQRVGPHTLRHAFITAPSTPACRCATYKKQPATPTPEPPCATTAAASPSTGTPPPSSPPSSPAPPADRRCLFGASYMAHRTAAFPRQPLHHRPVLPTAPPSNPRSRRPSGH